MNARIRATPVWSAVVRADQIDEQAAAREKARNDDAAHPPAMDDRAGVHVLVRRVDLPE
jgi:hypothetical protein